MKMALNQINPLCFNKLGADRQKQISLNGIPSDQKNSENNSKRSRDSLP